MSSAELGPQSGYWQTLTDPEYVHGCKIPDITFTESGTMTTTQRFDLVQGGAGTPPSSSGYCTGFYLGGSSNDGSSGTNTWFIPSQGACNLGNSGSTEWACGATCGSLAITGAPFSKAATAAGVSPLVFPGAETINSLASKVRLVSMSVEVTCGAAPLDQSGWYVCGVLPAQTHNSQNTWQNETNYTLRNEYQSQIFPIADGGVRMRYVPSDNSGISYCDWNAQVGDNTWLNDTRDVGEMFCLMDGAAYGSSFSVTIIRNWEYIPTDNSMMIGIGPSLVDYEAIEYAFNHVDSVVLADPLGKPSSIENALHSASGSVHSLTKRHQPPLRVPDPADPTGQTFINRDPVSWAPVFLHEMAMSRCQGLANKKGSKRRTNPTYNAKPALNSSLLERVGDTVLSLATKFAPSLLAMLL